MPNMSGKRTYIKSLFLTSGIWIIPIILVLLQTALFIPRVEWKTLHILYYITFWSIRVVLAPVVVIYTLKFWAEHWKIKFFLVHSVGLILYSEVFWCIGYLVLSTYLRDNELFGITGHSSDLKIFAIIADNSSSINVLVYISIVAFCYIWEYFSKVVKANKRAAELENSLLSSRLEVLKSQLNTHFLFNTLHTISSFVIRSENQQANKMLVNLSQLLRFALKENKDQLIPLRKELQILQLYLDIQKTRFNERLEIHLEYDNSLNEALIPPLILQPIVENAVKYGVEPFKQVGVIAITIYSKDQKLILIVEDNGRTPFFEIDFKTGIGLTNTAERLSELYENDYRLDIVSRYPAEGTKVLIEIPLKFNPHEVFSS